MAMSLPQQIGALSGTPIVADSRTVFSDPKSATVNASTVWRSLARSLRCVAARAGEIDRISPSPSPPLSPTMRLMRPNLLVACQALMEEVPAEEVVVVREYKEGGTKVKGKGVPVYMMMPLDSVTMGNTVNKRKAMNVSLIDV
ncbi:hypothetical protein LOK49_LG03G03065 [Camellia lanceoleosa]|uniref:Uncharacterized protein n=1 Tax=Camellia lanceoleosa TaxID=1840588 RepID=A0ACC0I819_9ERIC|nr:hypothetical protein LOK49_LG03G03065 [Camellia lanceoleosa]